MKNLPPSGAAARGVYLAPSPSYVGETAAHRPVGISHKVLVRPGQVEQVLPSIPEQRLLLPDIELLLRNKTRAAMEQCCVEHPLISIDQGIFGGVPHLKEMRLSVGDVLAQLYILGSIQAVVDAYAPDVTQSQVKEALAYAQDFLEMACESHQDNG